MTEGEWKRVKSAAPGEVGAAAGGRGWGQGLGAGAEPLLPTLPVQLDCFPATCTYNYFGKNTNINKKDTMNPNIHP